MSVKVTFQKNIQGKYKKEKKSATYLRFPFYPTVPLGDWLEKKNTSYNHKTTIWVSNEYYLNPEFHKILWRAFWVIAILEFSPYAARVDFKGLIPR